MMKLLIVDDECYTLEGIKKRLSWDELNIGEVQLAHDGEEGLEVAKVFVPDIILTDVRMPRMDGIEMSFKVRQIHPKCKIIFMSGYSDKEYLKSAIDLKVIDYVEKPLVMKELIEALTEAVKVLSAERQMEQMAVTLEKSLSTGIPVLRNEMAIKLTKVNLNLLEIEDIIRLIGLKVFNESQFATIVIKFFWDQTLDGNKIEILNRQLKTIIEKAVVKYNYECLYAFKDEKHLVLHVFSNQEGKVTLNEIHIQSISAELKEELSTIITNFIAVGTIMKGMENVYKSYNQAIIALQKAFFRGYNSCIFFKDSPTISYNLDEKLLDQFIELLYKEDAFYAVHFIKKITSDMKTHEDTLHNYIKNYFFRMYVQMNKIVKERLVHVNDFMTENDLTMDLFVKYNTLDEIMEFMVDKVENYYKSFKNLESKSSTITYVLKFIHENYSKSDLTIKDISNDVYLSNAYISTMFKQETGKTINQYITEYRMKKACELLKNKEMKLNEIAEKVGYSDSSYFTKIFKKIKGILPSEYREKKNYDF